MRGLAFQWVIALTALAAALIGVCAVGVAAIYGISYAAGWAIAGMTL